jgi:hypothetical protein
LTYLTHQGPGPFGCKREPRSSGLAKPKARLCEPWVVVVSYFRAAKRRQRVNEQANLLMLSPLAGLNRSNRVVNPQGSRSLALGLVTTLLRSFSSNSSSATSAVDS